jgi:integrase
MFKNKKYTEKYTIVKSDFMAKNYSIGFYTGGVKIAEWDNLKKHEKTKALQKSWYVRWSFRNPETGLLERQKNYKGGVNYLKTKGERFKALQELKKLLSDFIKEGYSPFKEDEQINIDNQEIEKDKTVKEAFDLALEQIKLTVSASTYSGYKKTSLSFLEFLGNQNKNKSIKLITRLIVIKYLNEILKKTSARTRNNYKADLSSLFSVMEKRLLILDFNFIKNIEKERTQEKRNRTLSNNQLKQVTDFLRENDPLLLLVVKFVSYNFLRPVEVCRLQIKDLNLEDALLYYQAKNKPLKTKRIPKILLNDLKGMNLDAYEGSSYLITPSGIPSDWEATDMQRRSTITRRFTRLKVKMSEAGIKLEKGDNIYSFRHSYITNLFRHLRTQENLSFHEAIQQLMPITGHDSESGLMNYIHKIDADIPKDWSEKIDIII